MPDGEMMQDATSKDKRKLKRGFTTGSCAAAAAKSAALLALSGFTGDAEKEGRAPLSASLVTPKGERLTLSLSRWKDAVTQLLEMPAAQEQVTFEYDPFDEEMRRTAALLENLNRVQENRQSKERTAVCCVKKYSGDDPDVTNGVLVFAKVTVRTGTAQAKGLSIVIDGGVGIGRVTKPGLACAVGQAAINPTPRAMIAAEVRRVAEELDYRGEIQVEISIPEGTRIAMRTYNPRLGITGGISVLGTSGIVEPMSEQALIDTIRVELDMCCASGAGYLLLTPGNYGEAFLKESMRLGDIYTVKCSNFLGDALEYAEEKRIKGILLVSHIGKLVKVAGGIMNTHSRYGDARMEILSAHAAMQGADRQTVRELMSCVTTDDALAVLDRVHLRQAAVDSLLDKVEFHLKEKTHHTMKAAAVMFSNKYGLLGQSRGAEELIRLLSAEHSTIG